MHTVCGTVLRTSSTRIRNYTDSDGQTGTGRKSPLSLAAPQHIRIAQVITQPQKLHSKLVVLVKAVSYRVTGLTCSFVYGMGVQHAVIIHNNLAGDTHPSLFFHMRPANEPTQTGADHNHKNVGRPWFTKHVLFDTNHSVSVHNAPFHSQCHTTHKRTNKTCHNHITYPINIHYLTLQFPYVTEHDRSPHTDTHTQYTY
jgi:hypothetical protein